MPSYTAGVKGGVCANSYPVIMEILQYSALTRVNLLCYHISEKSRTERQKAYGLHKAK